MPYVSEAQRGFFHAAEQRGDIDSATVKEFDRASKGKKLPKRKKKKRDPVKDWLSAAPGAGRGERGACGGERKYDGNGPRN